MVRPIYNDDYYDGEDCECCESCDVFDRCHTSCSQYNPCYRGAANFFTHESEKKGATFCLLVLHIFVISAIWGYSPHVRGKALLLETDTLAGPDSNNFLDRVELALAASHPAGDRANVEERPDSLMGSSPSKEPKLAGLSRGRTTKPPIALELSPRPKTKRADPSTKSSLTNSALVRWLWMLITLPLTVCMWIGSTIAGIFTAIVTGPCVGLPASSLHDLDVTNVGGWVVLVLYSVPKAASINLALFGFQLLRRSCFLREWSLLFLFTWYFYLRTCWCDPGYVTRKKKRARNLAGPGSKKDHTEVEINLKQSDSPASDFSPAVRNRPRGAQPKFEETRPGSSLLALPLVLVPGPFLICVEAVSRVVGLTGVGRRLKGPFATGTSREAALNNKIGKSESSSTEFQLHVEVDDESDYGDLRELTNEKRNKMSRFTRLLSWLEACLVGPDVLTASNAELGNVPIRQETSEPPNNDSFVELHDFDASLKRTPELTASTSSDSAAQTSAVSTTAEPGPSDSLESVQPSNSANHGQTETVTNGQAATKFFYLPNGERKPLRFCRYCNVYQPLRTKHCRECDRCVRTYDHHCPWVGNCVGERNRKFFLLYVTFQMLLLWRFLSYLLWEYSDPPPGGVSSPSESPQASSVPVDSHNYVRTASDSHRGHGSTLLDKGTSHRYASRFHAYGSNSWVATIHLVVAIGFLLIFGSMTFCMSVFHAYLCAANLTTWEHASWRRITYLRLLPAATSDFGSPFSKSLYLNCLSVFGAGAKITKRTRKLLERKGMVVHRREEDIDNSSDEAGELNSRSGDESETTALDYFTWRLGEGHAPHLINFFACSWDQIACCRKLASFLTPCVSCFCCCCDESQDTGGSATE